MIFTTATHSTLACAVTRPEILNGDLRVAILPLRKDAPIYMAEEARPHFGSAESIATLQGIEIIPRYQLQLAAP